MREDEGCGHVSVGGVRGRGVHYRGRDGGRLKRKSTDISIFRALSFPIYFLYLATPPVLIRFFLALILIRTNAFTHPHSSPPQSIPPSSVPCRSPIPSSLLPFPFLTPPYFPTCSLSHADPHTINRTTFDQRSPPRLARFLPSFFASSSRRQGPSASVTIPTLSGLYGTS